MQGYNCVKFQLLPLAVQKLVGVRKNTPPVIGSDEIPPQNS